MVKRTTASPEGADGARLRTALKDLRIALALGTRRVAALAGLKESDLEVLDLLTRSGPQSPTALARRLSMQPATMTGVLRRLEDAGWVIRRHHEHDRRSVEIESVGFDRLDALYRDASGRLDALNASMKPSEVETVLTFLHDVTAAITVATGALQDPDGTQPAETEAQP